MGVYIDVHEQGGYRLCRSIATHIPQPKRKKTMQDARKSRRAVAFSQGAYIDVRDQEKTLRNDELHSVFFVFYLTKAQKAR